MFESLKKKFSRTSDKLEEELKEEAEQEDNISPEVEDTKKRSFFSFGRKKEKKELDDSSLLVENTGEVVENNDSFDDEEELNEFKLVEPNEEIVSIEDKSRNGNNEEIDESLQSIETSEEEEETFLNEGKEDKKKPKKSHFSFWHRESSSDDKDNNGEKEESKEEEKIKKENDKNKEESSGGFFSFIREKTISEKHVENVLWDLEMDLLQSDVAMDVADKVVNSVKDNLVGKKIKRSNDITEYTFNALRDSVEKIIDIPGKSMTEMIEEKKTQGEPLVVMFVGINGTGKTTTIGKLANYYLKKGYTPVIAASDTFRAGAIEQVTYHADKVGVKVIKHQKGSDPAAVAFDAVEHARAQNKELILIDTAGRMQTNTNLMDEMKKIKRVSKPDLIIFVGDALTGNDATEQAIKFNDAIDVDGVILTKADADSKGGASLSIGYSINKPIMFLGMGQGYDDIKEYDPEWMLDQIF